MVIIKLLNKAKLYSTEIVAVTFFTLLSLIVTFPTILYLRTYAYAQFPGDPHGHLWGNWWMKLAWVSNALVKFCQIISSPFGVYFSKGLETCVVGFPFFLLSLLIDEVFAYNILAILAFLLSAICMYYLVYHFTKHKLASMVSGTIYAFCPYHFAQSYAHIELSSIQLMPLYVLFLFKFYEERTLKNALLCGLSFSLVVLEHGYYAFFMLVFTFIFLFFIFFRSLILQRRLAFNIRRWKMPILSVLFSLALVMPFILPTILRQYVGYSPIGQSPHLTALWEVESLTATFWNYLLPAPDNPVFGHLVEDFVYTRAKWMYPVNHVDYLGYVPIALALLGIIGWRRGRFAQNDEVDARLGWGIPFLVLAFLAAVIISALPSVRVFGIKILMPSYYLHEIAPMFRAFARFGVVAILMLSVLAGIGMKLLLENIRSYWKQLFITFLMITLVLAEFINVPPSKATDVSLRTVPPAYKWLASQPSDFTIVEYPVPAKEWHKYYAWMFYQKVHRKRMADPRAIPALAGKDYLYNLLRPGVSNVLQYLGIKYVIVHTDEYRDEGGSVITLTEEHGLKLVKAFPDTLVYEVVAKPSKILWMPQDGFFAPEFWGGWENYQEWVWMAGKAKLLTVNFAGRETYGDIVFKVDALGVPRTLRLSINGELAADVEVPPFVTTIVVRDVHLKAGENNLIFSTPSQAEEIDKYLHNGDKRAATFMLSEFKFEN